MKVNPYSKELTRAAEHLHAIEAEIDHIQNTITGLPAPDTSAAERFQAAKEAFEDTSAAQATGKPANVAEARKALETAEQAAERAKRESRENEAAKAGMKRRLARAEEERIEARKALDMVKHHWLLSEYETLDKRWAELVPEAARVISQAIAIRGRLNPATRPVAGDFDWIKLPVIGPISQEKLTPEPPAPLTEEAPPSRRSKTAFETGRANWVREEEAKMALDSQIKALIEPEQAELIESKQA